MKQIKMFPLDFLCGFEIEGLFKPELLKDVSNFGEIKYDGSVSYSDLLEMANDVFDDFRSDDYDSDYCEFSSKPDSLIKSLKLLNEFKNNKNYLFNKTCGLHWHISMKENNTSLRNLICNFEFIICVLVRQID